MIKAKQLKEIINSIPDEALITIGGDDHCNIVGHTERVETGSPYLIADLKLTEGYGIVTKGFLDAMFSMAANRLNV